MLRTTMALIALVPAVALAQRPPAAAPGATRAASDSIRGLQLGDRIVGGRVGVGVYNTASIGGRVELVRRQNDFGPGTIGLGGALDFYRYGASYAGVGEWSVTVIPISAYANYHFPLRNRRFDPYVGAGLGYFFVQASARAVDGSSASTFGRASSIFPVTHVGARYFMRPNLALDAETGLGISALRLGVSYRL